MLIESKKYRWFHDDIETNVTKQLFLISNEVYFLASDIFYDSTNKSGYFVKLTDFSKKEYELTQINLKQNNLVHLPNDKHLIFQYLQRELFKNKTTNLFHSKREKI